MFCHNPLVEKYGDHRVTNAYNTGFYAACQQETVVPVPQPCDACEKLIEEGCTYWCTVTKSRWYDFDVVRASEPAQVTDGWWCARQGCGVYCADCITTYGKNTDAVMLMHVGIIRECEVYWKKFTITAA